MKKLCKKCRVEKPIEQFGLVSKKHTLTRPECRECRTKYCREWQQKNRDKINSKNRERLKNPKLKRKQYLSNRSYQKTEKGQLCTHRNHLKRKYGITVEMYNMIFSRQGGKCAICETEQKDLDRRLCVDHDHSTGKIRGLLCRFCNTGVGDFKEDVDRMFRAINYLEIHRGKSV